MASGFPSCLRVPSTPISGMPSIPTTGRDSRHAPGCSVRKQSRTRCSSSSHAILRRTSTSSGWVVPDDRRLLLTLVDSLRCPAHDEESSLVLSVEEWAGPRVAEGLLGCPLCHARYRIHLGAIDFGPGPEAVRHADAEVDPFRLAAQLGLTEPGGIILLAGRYANVHEDLAGFVEATFVLVDAAATSSPMAVNFSVSERWPFTDRALRGAAIDDRRAASIQNDLVRCVRSGGRIVMPAAIAAPNGLTVIARDDRELVGEVVLATSKPVPLRRADPT